MDQIKQWRGKFTGQSKKKKKKSPTWREHIFKLPAHDKQAQAGKSANHKRDIRLLFVAQINVLCFEASFAFTS